MLFPYCSKMLFEFRERERDMEKRIKKNVEFFYCLNFTKKERILNFHAAQLRLCNKTVICYNFALVVVKNTFHCKIIMKLEQECVEVYFVHDENRVTMCSMTIAEGISVERIETHDKMDVNRDELRCVNTQQRRRRPNRASSNIKCE